MLSAFEACAAEKGYTTLQPDTTVQQEAARRSYISNGYRERVARLRTVAVMVRVTVEAESLGYLSGGFRDYLAHLRYRVCG